MNSSVITFIVDSKTYNLSASNSKAIRAIPPGDRQQLIALLEAIKHQDSLAKAAVQTAVDYVTAPLHGADAPIQNKAPKPERLGSGDADALMARLIIEEKRDKKPGFTKEGLYKIVAGFVAAIFLLMVIF
jgi:hypothetical protein